MAAAPSTRFFLADNGKVYQINNVTQITISSPLIARGTFRDAPPVVVGGAALVPTGFISGTSISGGVTATATDESFGILLASNSSVAQDDAFAHVDLRFVYSPEPMVFFKTESALTSANPTSTDFDNVRPSSRTPAQNSFDAFDVDCCFPWTENCGIFSEPPPGWSPGSSE